MNFAQWLSPSYAFKVSKWVMEWHLTGKKPEPAFDLSDPESLRQLVNATSTKLLEVQKQVVTKEAELSESPQKTAAMVCQLALSEASQHPWPRMPFSA